MNASLNEKLGTVKWGEFKLGDLFEVVSYKKCFDANKVAIIENRGHPYIVRQSTENGRKGNIDEPIKYLNPGNTISFGQDTATMFYQEKPYFTGDKIKILRPKYAKFGKNNAQFFLSTMRKAFCSFAWGSSRFNVETLKKQMLTMMGAFAQAESESISGNIQAGKRYAMQRGEATINYYSLYAYEKGPDGNPQIIPEQAEIVREIYQKYLHGDSLNMIRKDLEERHIPNARGGATWTHTAVRGILSNEKYVGDVLMQKTFQQDCISRKTIRNTGQRTMYLVPDHHEAIIDRKTYNAVQTELARRNALKGNTQKSTPSGRSCYTPKYALSDRLICGECGTLYRRCTWVNRGKKHIVWRCISRSDYGKKYCHDSPSVDEQQLQQAILRAINSIMSEKPALVRQVTENLQVLIHPSRSGELTIADIDHQLETLAREFDATFATAAIGNAADYSERFKMILTQQTELKAKRVELERQQAEDAELNSHMEEAADIMGQAGTAITEWNERNIRDLVESVRILSKEKILVRLKSGIEKTEKLQS